MRLTAIFPVLCAVIALILSFLCIFAGSKPGMMENYNIVTFNTSAIGVDFFNTTAPQKCQQDSSSDNFLESFIDDPKCHAANILNDAEAHLEDAANQVLQTFAKSLGIHDWYSIHILDFCEGFFSPNGTSNKNITYCSNSTSLFSFNITNTLQRELQGNGLDVDLSKLHWPDAINEGLDTLREAFHVMFVLYCMAIVAIGLSLLASLGGLFSIGRSTAVGNIVLAFVATGCLIISSSIVTYAADKATDVVNKYGKPIDVNATRGNSFIALTWATTALMGLSALWWCGECCFSRKREKMIPKQYQ